MNQMASVLDEKITVIEEYECDECGQVFDSRWEARNHIQDEHLESKGKGDAK